jgi:hypothetical protein
MPGSYHSMDKGYSDYLNHSRTMALQCLTTGHGRFLRYHFQLFIQLSHHQWLLYERGGQTDEIHRTLRFNLDKSHVLNHQVERTVATLLTAWKKADCICSYILYASSASRVVATPAILSVVPTAKLFKQKDRQCTVRISVILRRDLATIVAVDKQEVLHIVCVCVCRLVHPACNAHASYCHLWPASLYYIFPHSLKRQDFRQKKLPNTKCVLWFPLQIFSVKFLILRRNERDMMVFM